MTASKKTKRDKHKLQLCVVFKTEKKILHKLLINFNYWNDIHCALNNYFRGNSDWKELDVSTNVNVDDEFIVLLVFIFSATNIFAQDFSRTRYNFNSWFGTLCRSLILIKRVIASI